MPPNCHFFVDDIEDDWNYSAPFDFIYSRFSTGSIANWPRFFKQSYENLTPGGSIEIYDAIYPLCCDDGSLAKDAPINRWSILLNEGMRGMGRPLDTALYYQEQLADAGFTDIGIVREIWPINRWPKDKKYKQIGKSPYHDYLGGLALLVLR
ncbi:methyltransferase domain-containing protein [Candidatus Bathyarchaeota archaeon]|nr:methyltransferase domain-containing protein [Candidatus Bathyarchaeota archaeon]